MVTERPVTEVLDTTGLRLIPEPGVSKGAHLLADPALDLADEDDRREQVTAWVTQIALDAGLRGMKQLLQHLAASQAGLTARLAPPLANGRITAHGRRRYHHRRRQGGEPKRKINTPRRALTGPAPIRMTCSMPGRRGGLVCPDRDPLADAVTAFRSARCSRPGEGSVTVAAFAVGVPLPWHQRQER